MLASLINVRLYYKLIFWIIVEDCNLPCANFDDPSANCDDALCLRLFASSDNHPLTQLVQTPTLNENILNLFLTNNTKMHISLDVIFLMAKSNHNAIISSLNIDQFNHASGKGLLTCRHFGASFASATLRSVDWVSVFSGLTDINGYVMQFCVNK